MDILTLNWFVALGALGMLSAGFAIGVADTLGYRAHHPFVRRYSLTAAAAIAVVATALSLVYSEHFGVLPCGLCWFARICLFSMAIILPVAWWRNDVRIAPYALALSGVGALISLYHHYIQMGGTSALPCPASGAGDCAKRFIFEFGFVTFPLIGFACFALLIVMFVSLYRSGALDSEQKA